MGNRGDLLRALSVAALASACAGCLDFVEPELPERGAPAVAQIAVVLTDSGAMAVTGTLAPGFDEDGLRRTIVDATAVAAGRLFAPVDTAADGSLRYATALTVESGATEQVIEIRAPRLGIATAPPAVRWPGLRRLDADTIVREPDGSLRLHVAIVPPDDSGGPAPDIEQWFLTLTGEEEVFRLSSDGAPPAQIDVPPQWVPDGPVAVRLIHQQSARLEPVPTYIALITLDLRVHWTVSEAEGR